MNKYRVPEKAITNAQAVLGGSFPVKSDLVRACVLKTNAYLASINTAFESKKFIIEGHIPKTGGTHVITMCVTHDFKRQLDILKNTLRIPHSKCIGTALSFCAARPAWVDLADWIRIGLGLSLQGSQPSPPKRRKKFKPIRKLPYLFVVDPKVLLNSISTTPESIVVKCRTLLKAAIELGELKLLTPDYDRLCKAIAHQLNQAECNSLSAFNTALSRVVDLVPPSIEVYKQTALTSARLKEDADACLVCAFSKLQPPGFRTVILAIDEQYLRCAAKHQIPVWTPWDCNDTITSRRIILPSFNGKGEGTLTINEPNRDALRTEID